MSSSSSSSSSGGWVEESSSDADTVRERFDVWPLDEHNVKLLNEVRPKVWNEEKDDDDLVYDLVVIGAGAGGLVSSRQVARRGGRSVMISSKLAGGDCLNVGCVPSKALIASAKRIREVRRTLRQGVEFVSSSSSSTTTEGGEGLVLPAVDFAGIMRHMRRMRAHIAPVDGHERGRQLGVTVLQGFGRFVDPHTIEVVQDQDQSRRVVRFRKAVIATGGRAMVPSDVPGLAEAPYTTNDTLFNFDTKTPPPRLVVLGSGVVALEMAQTFATFGSQVTVLVRGDTLFPNTVDEDVGRAMQKALEEQDGVTFLTRTTLEQVETLRTATAATSTQQQDSSSAFPLLRLSLSNNNNQEKQQLSCECLLVATGRVPNLEGLQLERANVDYRPGAGVLVNDLARSTSNPNVYAVGDCVAGVPRLTHMSGEMAKLVVQNASFDDQWKLSDLVVPACMYTEPEMATVGRTKNDADTVDTYATTLQHNDRAITEGLDSVDRKYGMVKVFTKKGTGTILGAVVVASRAGEIINEVTLAIKHGISLEGIGRNIHCYPTTGEAVMGCGLQLINSKWKRLD